MFPCQPAPGDEEQKILAAPISKFQEEIERFRPENEMLRKVRLKGNFVIILRYVPDC